MVTKTPDLPHAGEILPFPMKLRKTRASWVIGSELWINDLKYCLKRFCLYIIISLGNGFKYILVI